MQDDARHMHSRTRTKPKCQNVARVQVRSGRGGAANGRTTDSLALVCKGRRAGEKKYVPNSCAMLCKRAKTSGPSRSSSLDRASYLRDMAEGMEFDRTAGEERDGKEWGSRGDEVQQGAGGGEVRRYLGKRRWVTSGKARRKSKAESKEVKEQQEGDGVGEKKETVVTKECDNG